MDEQNENKEEIELQEKNRNTNGSKAQNLALPTSKQIWEHFMQTVTLHAISRCFDKKSSFSRRLAWLVIFLSFWGLFVWKLKASVEHHLTYPFNTQVLFEPSQKDLIFPAVSICNMNLGRYSMLNGTDTDTWIKSGYEPKYEPNHTRDMELDMAHNASSMVYECVWKKNTLCSYKNFTDGFKIGEEDVCFTFNAAEKGKKALSVNKAGVGSGLILTINVETWDYYIDMKRAGLFVYVHESDDRPIKSGKPIAAKPGYTTYIELQKSEIHRLRAPYRSDCGNPPLKYFDTYSRKKCYLEALTTYVVDICGCKESFMPADVPNCKMDEIKCVWDSWIDFDSNVNMFYKKCPIPCTSTEYDSSLSYAAFPSNSYADEWAKTINMSGTTVKNRQELRKNFLELNIYFGALDFYKFTEVETYNSISLLNDIGGQLGLFLGASALTVLEVFDVLVVMLRNHCKARARKANITRTEGESLFNEDEMFIELKETSL